MEVSTRHLVLAPDAAIDLQLHTTFSDGTWTPEQLLDYLAHEQFGLVAITDHDRVDTAPMLQQLAAEKHLPLLTAVEMSTSWNGELTDVLCFGFDPENNALQELAHDLASVVNAAHRSGALCLIAHPGRGEGYTCYDTQLLDELRRHVSIDGLEVYHPAHTPEQMVMYREYAKTHNLLTSSGSDSHGPE